MPLFIFIYGSGRFDNYRAALTASGATPITAEDGVPCADCHGLLLPGGGDIIDTLDEQEHQLIRSFALTGRPILGICRGMQALNVFFGGTLYGDIPGHRISEGDMIHPTTAEGPIADLLGAHPVVNSNHHQAVDRLGEGLVVCQRTDDGIVEGLFHPDLPILGVQWHPERQSFARLRPDANDAAPVFLSFIDQVRSTSGRTFEGSYWKKTWCVPHSS